MSRDTRDDLKDRSLPEASFLPLDFLSGRAGMVSEETLANPAILVQVFAEFGKVCEKLFCLVVSI